jgi:hypothetical protein
VERQFTVAYAFISSLRYVALHIEQGESLAKPYELRFLQVLLALDQGQGNFLFRDRIGVLVGQQRSHGRSSAAYIPLLNHNPVTTKFQERFDRALLFCLQRKRRKPTGYNCERAKRAFNAAAQGHAAQAARAHANDLDPQADCVAQL